MPRLFPFFLVLALLCGCSDAAPSQEASPASVPMPAPMGSVLAGSGSAGLAPSLSSPAVDEPPGTITCTLLGEAVSAATLMDPGVIDSIVAAASTADAPVADAAQRLATAYAAALTSRGAEGEPDAVAAVSAAATDMSGVCADSGLRSVG
ncbi:MAG TPA: hypothetical protein VGB74_13070 [Actinoplanes sp.]